MQDNQDEEIGELEKGYEEEEIIDDGEMWDDHAADIDEDIQACDTPATRKVCGFYGHMAKCGCSKCTKNFETNPDNGAMCYGGDFNTVSAPRKEDDHRAQAFLGQQQVSNAAKQRVESLSGSRFTSLMHLEYFDCIRFHIIDAMHNLFLALTDTIKLENIADEFVNSSQHRTKCNTVDDRVDEELKRYLAVPESDHLTGLDPLNWCIVDRGPTVGPTDGHGPGLFDLCTVAVRSRSGYLEQLATYMVLLYGEESNVVTQNLLQQAAEQRESVDKLISSIEALCGAMVATALREIPSILSDVMATATTFRSILAQFGRCHELYDGNYINEYNASQLAAAIPSFMESFRRAFPKATTPIKMHLLEDHALQWANRMHVGFGLLGEQGAESIHAKFNTLLSQYNTMHDKVKKLL
ncbi:hypothetical protein EMCRGX_G003912 [Ephydatia muelleri]